MTITATPSNQRVWNGGFVTDLTIRNEGATALDPFALAIGLEGRISDVWRSEAWEATAQGARVSIGGLAPGEATTIRLKGTGLPDLAVAPLRQDAPPISEGDVDRPVEAPEDRGPAADAPEPAPAAVSVVSLIEKSWRDGFIGEVVVTNDGPTALDSASVEIDLPGAVEGLWGATSWQATADGARAELEAIDLAPGESMVIRFKGSGAAEFDATVDGGPATPPPANETPVDDLPGTDRLAPSLPEPEPAISPTGPSNPEPIAVDGDVVHVGTDFGAGRLQALIDQSPAGTVLMLEAGRHRFDRTIEIGRDDITIVGAGSGETVIEVPSSLGQEVFSIGDGSRSGSYTLSRSVGEGAKTLTFSGGHGFEAGDFVYLARESTDAFYDEIGDTAWRKDVPLRTSIVEVASVDGNTVHLASGVHFDFVPSETSVAKIDLVDNVAIGGFTVDYGLGRADPSDFANRLGSYDRDAVIQVEGTVGLKIRDVVAHDVPSLGVNVALSRAADVDGVEITGAHNKGSGGNGYALQIRDVYDSSFTNLSDMDMRHSVVFASWRSAVGNEVHVSSTDRDINFHGGRDHGNTVMVDRSVRDANSDIIAPTLFVNTEGTHYGSVTDGDANVARFGHVVGTRLRDDVRGYDGGSWLDGAGSHDTLTGGDGDDVLIGGEGRDLLRGGAGEDMAVYKGARSDFGITKLSTDSWEVDDRSGDQDTDVVEQVEWLVFDDGALRLSDQAFLALSAIEDVYDGVGAPAASPSDVPARQTADAPASSPATLVGTDGKDVIDVTVAGTTVSGRGDWDVVRSTVDFLMSDDVERLELIGTAAIDGIGSAGADIILGNDAANVIRLGAGDDRSFGRLGDDILDGGRGDDQIDGGGGDDLIFGGLGADTLRGRSGEDRFAFASASDSTRDAADLILDFESGIDRLDLSRIDADATREGDQAFGWRSSGPGALSFRDGTLSGDVDGDGRADLWIELGDGWLAQGDVIL
jgi:Ca2+-binding RTX toxin-like protein